MLKGFISLPKHLKTFVLVVGPCRSGTTALSNNFVRTGVESHMQPIKSFKRAVSNDEKLPPNFNIKSDSIVNSKETIGPNYDSEFFDPVKEMLKAGLKPYQLVVIPILRNPLYVFDSWKRLWGSADINKLARAFEIVSFIRQYSLLGVRVIPYVHELIKENSSDLIISKFFDLVGVESDPKQAVQGWKDFKNQKADIHFYDDPPEKFINGIEKRGGYHYKARKVSKLTKAAVSSCKRVQDIYASFVKVSQKLFGVKVT